MTNTDPESGDTYVIYTGHNNGGGAGGLVKTNGVWSANSPPPPPPTTLGQLTVNTMQHEIATGELRFCNRYPRMSTIPKKTLQQKWIVGGKEEWRDIPEVDIID